MRAQPKCKRCHERTVPRPGMVCNVCRKHTGGSSNSSRPVSGGAQSVFERLVTNAMPVAHPTRQTIYPLDVMHNILDAVGRDYSTLTTTEYSGLFRVSDRWADWINTYRPESA